jgi:PIN domain nuclease of toxin-antitoxin system
MAIWEIAIKVKNKKLDLGISLDTYISKLKQSDVVQIVPINEEILVQSVNNLQWSNRDPVDRIMVTLALHNNCSIITKDLAIREFYSQTIW